MIRAGAAGLALAVAWMALSLDALTPLRLLTGLLAVAAALTLAWRLGAFDAEGAPYDRLPSAIAAVTAGFGAWARAALALAGAVLRGRGRGGHLARVRRSRAGHEASALHALSAHPGVLALDGDAESVLVHVLDDAAAPLSKLIVLEAAATRSVAGGPP